MVQEREQEEMVERSHFQPEIVLQCYDASDRLEQTTIESMQRSSDH